MRFAIQLQLIVVLLFCLLSARYADAQTYSNTLKVGEAPPAWLISEEPTYDIVKQKFIEHYGTDQKGWPFFIQEIKRLTTQYQLYNAEQASPKDQHYHTFFNIELGGGGENPKSDYKFGSKHLNSTRNYFSFFHFYYPGVLDERGKLRLGDSEWQKMLQKKEELTPLEQSYINASKKDGILAAIFYMYASYCPVNLLDWCFSEVFPLINLLYSQETKEGLIALLKAVQTQIKSYCENLEFQKAYVYNDVAYRFVYYYDRVPGHSARLLHYNHYEDTRNIQGLEREVRERFDTVFRQNMQDAFAGRFFDVKLKFIHPYEGNIETTGTLYYNPLGDKPKARIVVSKNIPASYLERKNYQVEYHYLDYQGTRSFRAQFQDKKFNNSVVYLVDEPFYYFTFENEIKSANEVVPEVIFGLKEICRGGTGISYEPHLPRSNDWSHIGGSDIDPFYVIFSSNDSQRFYDLQKEAFYKTFEEIYGRSFVKNEIPGLELEESNQLEYELTVTRTPEEVKPDGESTVEITATLSEYTGGDINSLRRLGGKRINFILDEFSDFKVGELSAKTVVTDDNGQAKVTFTAPTGERLQQAPSLKNTSTVNAVCEEFDVEDKAYIGYILEHGKVMVKPAPGVISTEGIVPPDKRFPALIRAFFEDEHLNPLINAEVRFWIAEDSPLGMLRRPDGKEGTELTLITDEQGIAEVQYFFAAEEIPTELVKETIEISSAHMAIPFKAEITIGFNIVFDKVENAYEGKGEINAGEEIPLRVFIKHVDYPDLDLMEFFYYWGAGDQTGNTELQVKFEVENISTVPKSLLDQLKLEKYPPENFSEFLRVKSFKDKGIYNMLWVPEASLEGYVGYPKIKPGVTGNHYYEAKLTITDGDGKEIHASMHPARKSLFNVEVGLAADAGIIFFISNPFKRDTKEQKLLATTLDIMGFGAILSVVDALYMINDGDVEGLYSMLFSEVKGAIFDKVSEASAYSQLTVDLYTGMALAEKIGLEIFKDQTGPIAKMETTIFNTLYNEFNWDPGQLVILRGFGDQKLYKVSSAGKESQKSMFEEALFGSDNETGNENPDQEPAAEDIRIEIPTAEGKYLADEEMNTTSLKKNYISIYIIPADMKVRAENALEMKRY